MIVPEGGINFNYHIPCICGEDPKIIITSTEISFEKQIKFKKWFRKHTKTINDIKIEYHAHMECQNCHRKSASSTVDEFVNFTILRCNEEYGEGSYLTRNFIESYIYPVICAWNDKMKRLRIKYRDPMRIKCYNKGV